MIANGERDQVWAGTFFCLKDMLWTTNAGFLQSLANLDLIKNTE